MSTLTLGTNATTSLTALAYLAGISSMVPVDQAAIANAIKNDVNPAHPIWPGAFSANGLLFVPNRGVLQMLPGDYVGVDDQGWPILVSANSIANGAWTHS